MNNDSPWTTGDIIVFRGVNKTKIWYALPVFVVQDTPELVALYWPAGTRGKFRLKPSREKVTPRDAAQVPMDVLDYTWVNTDVLMLIRPGAAHAIYVMWEAGHGAGHRAGQKKHLCWYCNLQDPIHKTSIGYDTRDHWLDIVFQPDKSGWRWKDEDQMDEVVALGLCSAEAAQAIRAEGERVIRLFEENQPPFCDGWEHWSAPAGWQAAELPGNWDMG
jgi:hypothetical protein